MSTPHRDQPGAKAVVNGVLVCDRCGRQAVGWPLKRADVCSGPDWVYCIRNPPEVMASWRAHERKAVPARGRGGKR